MIEVVVALALLAAGLAAIASLVATTATGARTLEQRVALAEAVRLVATALPRPEAMTAADLAGTVAGHRFEVRVSPYFGGGSAVADSPWLPVLVELRVRSPSGAVFATETVRLQRRPKP